MESQNLPSNYINSDNYRTDFDNYCKINIKDRDKFAQVDFTLNIPKEYEDEFLDIDDSYNVIRLIIDKNKIKKDDFEAYSCYVKYFKFNNKAKDEDEIDKRDNDSFRNLYADFDLDQISLFSKYKSISSDEQDEYLKQLKSAKIYIVYLVATLFCRDNVNLCLDHNTCYVGSMYKDGTYLFNSKIADWAEYNDEIEKAMKMVHNQYLNISMDNYSSKTDPRKYRSSDDAYKSNENSTIDKVKVPKDPISKMFYDQKLEEAIKNFSINRDSKNNRDRD